MYADRSRDAALLFKFLSLPNLCAGSLKDLTLHYLDLTWFGIFPQCKSPCPQGVFVENSSGQVLNFVAT